MERGCTNGVVEESLRRCGDYSFGCCCVVRCCLIWERWAPRPTMGLPDSRSSNLQLLRSR